MNTVQVSEVILFSSSWCSHNVCVKVTAAVNIRTIPHSAVSTRVMYVLFECALFSNIWMFIRYVLCNCYNEWRIPTSCGDLTCLGLALHVMAT